MSTMVARLLRLAEDIVDAHPDSSSVKRRAVSTAYYAAFHALARLCADTLLGDSDRASSEYEKVYRALDHGSLRTAFQPKGSPLATNVSLKRIGDLIVPLQGARMLADYAPPRLGFYQENAARDHLEQARELVGLLEALSASERMSLAIHLIFKDRPK
ncbi:hypothetical protein MKK55_17320 [Methylobacterium sp. J-059]|jgi:hypothetical protein|uniref:hypothetical protein n=1 Tax=unclassified Methylobacterium TaxID=2615210 RepID=UPI0011CC62BC|nr:MULTISPECIES: hypothetical protein [unclassified Methylobacterium]MCJ2006862.1 hypothetical protein [Methylobacterium sp. J-092]MCJ2040693.1 hypothetical protein [Methylobacterium sp. J-059]TXM94143.1 hypothetical protein FV223_05715 [Methylobacterium sp. WL116]